jgi:signal transduction histidine kinase
MGALFWQVVNRSTETQFILSLVQLLLAGLSLLVVLHQFRTAWSDETDTSGSRLLLGLLLLASQFGLHVWYFGLGFFFHKELAWLGIERLAHGLGVCGFLMVAAAFIHAPPGRKAEFVRWSLGTCLALAAVLVIDILVPWPALNFGEHSVAMVFSDTLILIVAATVAAVVLTAKGTDWRAHAVVLACLIVVFLLHVGSLFVWRRHEILTWGAEQLALVVLLFSLAWAVGERSRDLLDRVFIRLNLTFIVVASLILLSTTGMEKLQYLRLAEERSMDLAEFLRGHVVYYRTRGETLDVMFHRPDVLRRVVVEFGTLPELREVHVSVDGQSVVFRYSPDGEVTEDVMPVAQRNAGERGAGPRDSFRMIELPIETGADPDNRVELVGTMDYVNAYIGRYIILIYSLFTLMVGVATGVIAIIITDAERQRRRQYAELQETHQRLAQAAKLASIGELAGGMAHEINTPMTSILSLATHMTEGRAVSSLTPDQRKSLDVIATQAQRASRIVGNLLTFARQSRLELSRVDVGELLEMAIGLVHYRLDHGTVRIDCEIDEDLPFVLADAGRVTEVFVNLLNNAIDAIPAGGTLVVRASVTRDAQARVRVEVADTGSGISPDDLPRIFDPFFTTKPPGQGTGLGLSISHSIVKDHGGEIWAESSVGSGTTVVVTLPAGGDPK